MEEGNCFLDGTKSHVCVDNVYGQIYSINIAIQVSVLTELRLYDDETYYIQIIIISTV